MPLPPFSCKCLWHVHVQLMNSCNPSVPHRSLSPEDMEASGIPPEWADRMAEFVEACDRGEGLVGEGGPGGAAARCTMAAGAQLWCSDSQPCVPHGSQGGANWTGQPLTDPSILAEHLHLQPARTAGDLPQHCDMCGGLHFLRRTDRPMSAARQCDECGTRHPVRQNEVWFESASAGGWAVRFEGDGMGGMHVRVRSLSAMFHPPQLVACLRFLSALLYCCALC